ncbi:kelch repeat and BTB domain-containing protein 2-like [Branchiostoma floridae x Branchiostoma japonicum]
MNVKKPDHPTQVLHELNTMRERAELTDVVLEVEGRSFPCHRAVLALCSPYFHGMFTSGYAEAKQERINIQEVSQVAMATILDYAYTGCLQTEPDQVQAVMSAARLLQVDFICHNAAVYMKDHLDVSNCADVLMYADMLANSDLVKASEEYIASRFQQVVLQPSFLQLPLFLLQSLLNREDLMTSSEDNIVQAALRWVDFNQEERLQHLPALCGCFRRSFISSDQLVVELERKCQPTDCKLVYSDSTTQRLGQTRTEMQIFLREENYSFLTYLRSAPCYDPSTGRLHAIELPPQLDYFSVTATARDELYLAGGIFRWIKKPSHVFYQYNHRMNTWEERCGMSIPRARCGLVYLKGYIYAIGGDATKETVERYNPSCDEWTSLPPIPCPMISDFCAVGLNDSIYLISKEGCYCFSITENKWNKIADMIQPPLHPQAVTYQGSIYCVDCEKDWRDSSSTCVEKYNPTEDEWKWSGNGSFTFDSATLMKYGDTMYLLTVIKRWNLLERENHATICIFQYQPETDSWLYLKDKGRLVPPMLEWLGSGSSTDCLTAKMIPTCLGHVGDSDEDEQEDFEEEEEEEMYGHFSHDEYVDENALWRYSISDVDSDNKDGYDDEEGYE